MSDLLLQSYAIHSHTSTSLNEAVFEIAQSRGVMQRSKSGAKSVACSFVVLQDWSRGEATRLRVWCVDVAVRDSIDAMLLQCVLPCFVDLSCR